MKWTDRLRALYRGVKLGTQAARGVLAKPRIEPNLAPAEIGRLVTFDAFGDNPGRLRMLAYVPGALSSGPLVVLLHGCGQDPAQFAADSGWIELAERLQVPLVLPVQAEANNAGRCFQWFQPSQIQRNRGEVGSIASMTRMAIDRFGSDPRRVFVVGLSAGGAMAAALLAAYPDLFAAGASVAGLPVGAARSGMQAILRMASAGPQQNPEAWADHVRAAAPSGFVGPWPRLSIWQGQADTTVAPENATLLATQWRALHGLDAPEMVEQVRNGVTHRTWPGTAGPGTAGPGTAGPGTAGPDGKQRLVELWSLPLLAHGYPAGTRVVAPGRFVEQAPVDATAGIARFFGLD